jgi:hypothetical protein
MATQSDQRQGPLSMPAHRLSVSSHFAVTPRTLSSLLPQCNRTTSVGRAEMAHACIYARMEI